ncbi:pyruvate kinase [candidate division WWE3 bacterium]|uniref:Pyruvate kinase n=1 Tax=candidate division WWE3 bacterium TaxID=2053526 RepID=A0A955LKY3_UNCKA|nr:pyruvate kinase [candidate division WWE3 bacterium]
MSKTKIVATLGPASQDPNVIREMIEAGVDVIRLNTKHADPSWHKEQLLKVRDISEEIEKPVAVLVDLQGPELRIETKDDLPMHVGLDEKVMFGLDFDKTEKSIRVQSEEFFSMLTEGDEILIDNGYQEFTVISVSPDSLIARSLGDYYVQTRKGLNIPGSRFTMSSLIDRDIAILDMLEDVGADFVALSFVRRKSDIDLLRVELEKRNIKTNIVSKVEGVEAIENIDEIIQATDAVMVARGDLGIELPIEEVVYWQKEIIKKCRIHAKPVITATEMLESMVNNPKPTRAEVSDVANAIYDGTDAIMLSAESATGKYPVKAIQMMERISRFNEEKNELPILEKEEVASQSKAVTHAVMDLVSLNKDFAVDTAVVFTETGTTARDLARFRPKINVIAVTESELTRNQLCMSYGVDPHKMLLPDGVILEIDSVVKLLMDEKILHTGSKVVLVHGDHWKIPGLTNTITIKEIK